MTYERIVVDGECMVGPQDTWTTQEHLDRISALMPKRRGRLIYDQKPKPKTTTSPRKSIAQQQSWDFDPGRIRSLIDRDTGAVLETPRLAEIRDRG